MVDSTVLKYMPQHNGNAPWDAIFDSLRIKSVTVKLEIAPAPETFFLKSACEGVSCRVDGCAPVTCSN